MLYFSQNVKREIARQFGIVCNRAAGQQITKVSLSKDKVSVCQLQFQFLRRSVEHATEYETHLSRINVVWRLLHVFLAKAAFPKFNFEYGEREGETTLEISLRHIHGKDVLAINTSFKYYCFIPGLSLKKTSFVIG